MIRKIVTPIVIGCLLIAGGLHAQSADSKLAALEKLPAHERQQKLLEAARSEGEAVIYANMDVSAM